MSSSLKQRFALSAVAASVLATGLVAVGTTTASAATTTTKAPAVAAKPSAKPLTPAQRQAQIRARTIAKFGVYPLPVGYGAIVHYRLGKAALRQIAVAKWWAAQPKARSVRACESGGNYFINTGNGYYGAYQFDAGTWLANGGGWYASRAHLAPAFAQDQIAYRTWLARGWSPWACA